MSRIPQKRSKVKKKKKTKKKLSHRSERPVIGQTASRKKKVSRKPSGTTRKKTAKRKAVVSKVKPKAVKKVAKKSGKAVKKISKKAAKRKTKTRVAKKRKKRGELRDFTDQVLGTRQSQVQVLQRLSEKLPGIFLPGMVETDESLMMQRMIRAEQLGTFDEVARNLAMEFDWGLREVYELWHSPDIYF